MRSARISLPAEPDHAFDGYVVTAAGKRVPCDVQIWLPRGASESASLSVFMAADVHSVNLQGLAILKTTESVEKLGFRFEARDVHVRSGKSRPGFRAGGAQLTINYVGQWSFSNARAPLREPDSGQPEVELVLLTLSPVRYGAPEATSTPSYLGHREYKYKGAPKQLQFIGTQGGQADFTWELQRHWAWPQIEDDAVSGYAVPVLALQNSRQPLTAARLEEVRSAADDACTLLTLAARHRVVARVLSYSTPEFRVQEWRKPLDFEGSLTEEEASGPLVAESELEQFFERASAWWSTLNVDRKDAVRLAIYALHRFTDTTMESDFMAKFAALEGLAKRWGKGSSTGAQVSDMLNQVHVSAGGLWPLFEPKAGEPLFWLRNEIAHGRTVPRLSSALVLAGDHLHLWIEKVLLGLIGFSRQDSSDWLSSQVPLQQAEVSKLRNELRVAAKKPSPA